MATALPPAADSALHATGEQANFERLTRLLVCGGITLLREVFDFMHPPANLPTVLSNHKAQLRKLRNQNVINQQEWCLLYPSPGVYGNSTKFDITLLLKLFRNICNLTPPVTGWDKLPNSTDLSIEADLVRIKFYRNEVYGHSKNMEISDTEFVDLWRVISEALLRIAGSLSVAKNDEWKKSIDKFLHDPLTPDSAQSLAELQSWYKKDMDLKDMLEQQMNFIIDILNEIKSKQCESFGNSGQLPTASHLQEAGQQTGSVCIPISPEQPQAEEAAGSQTNQQISSPDNVDIWHVILSFKNAFKSLVEYLRKKLGVDVKDSRLGSLIITVSCNSLQVFEGLWEDYQSGHLNKVIQETLVTAEVLKELGLSELKLKTIISEEEYKACKEQLTQGLGAIDEIDDIAEMLQTMASLGISCKGLKTLEQMKHRVKNELRGSAEKPSWTAGKAFSVLLGAKDEDARKRDSLLNLFVDAEKILNKMDEKILNLLRQKVGNVEERMNDHKLQLAQREYFLLVAGETGSGKSSLVNLILGEELLPHSALSTTSTICELKFGKEPKLVAHFKDKDPETGLQPKVIPLREPTGSTQQSYLQQILPFFHVKSEREKGSIFKKIELFWPHSLLEKGVVIIDSPGFGESDIMDEIVTQYLRQAFVFIYVINSANAGGVQKDRLEKLLEQVRRSSHKGQGELPSKWALFVCNKWDQVPEEEVKEVKNHVVRNLQRRWPGLDPESQIIYMSTKKASKGQNFGIITQEFSSLMNGVRTMVLKSIDARLEIHWRWLDYLLSRIVYQAKAFVKYASRDREKVLKKIEQILFRLTAIETQQGKVIEELQKYLKDRVDDAMRKLADYLSSEEVKVRFTSWTLDEVPRVEISWEVTENEITKVLSRRLREIIERWEEDNQLFTSARESLVKHFQQRYRFVEGQLQNLETAVTFDHVHVPQDVPLNDVLTVAGKVIVGITSPFWLPLGLVVWVIGAPIVGVMAIKKKVNDIKKIKEYKADKRAFMTRLSAEYLDEATSESSLETFVREQLENAKLCLKQIKARIPELIQADKMLYEQLMGETISQEEIQQSYQPMMNEGSELRGHLAVFVFTEVCGNGISSEELEWKEDASHRLGCGAFGAVYKGKMTRRGAVQPMPVALKVCNKVLDAANASGTMAEVELLRKLDHPYIVAFYGVSLLKNMDNVRVILVMEKCKENLKSRIFNNPECIPGKSGNPSVVWEVCLWVNQITAALAYIHKQGVVHRDLKLENILVTEDDHVKVTDVGASKPAVDITGTFAGTYVYIAPEVFHSEVYDFKADIYSLGIILWEMWYGQQAFAKITAESLADFFAIVDEGYRPEPLTNYKQPPGRWDQLMKQCWSKNPEERPTAGKCNQEITELSAEVAIGH